MVQVLDKSNYFNWYAVVSTRQPGGALHNLLEAYVAELAMLECTIAIVVEEADGILIWPPPFGLFLVAAALSLYARS